MSGVPWKRLELAVLCAYALVFYLFMIRKSLQLSQGTPTFPLSAAPLYQHLRAELLIGITSSLLPAEYSGRLYGLRAGSLAGRLNVCKFCTLSSSSPQQLRATGLIPCYHFLGPV
jgi:hypothetical protein